MNSVPNYFRSIVAALVLLAMSSGAALAQDVSEKRGTMGLVEGRQYVVSFPQVWASPTEKPLPQPMLLFISSRSEAKVKISTPSLINDAPKLEREYTVRPNEVLRVPVPTSYMNQESEARNGYGISVTADKPISVSTYQAWMGNGELARQLPVEAWGRNYYTMNFYQDRYGSSSQGYKYRPGQILIIAAKDNTVVSYTPTFDTEGGRDQPPVRKGQTGIVTLEKGETFLIKAKIDEPYNKEFTTDLSGTWIRSSRPVGVVSGHTKVAIMRYPDVLPPTGMFAAEAHFVRNNVHDAMLPFEMAGTEFVTVPAQYTPTRVTGQASVEFGIDDDRGDVIRFVALEDGTTIQAMRGDGSDFKNIKSLNRGETWLETSVETATMWKSDKPMLVGHYGKSYAKILPPAFGTDGNKKGEGTLGHPTVESGMPMLQYVPSTDRWVNYAVFHSPEGMDNFFNIVFTPDQVAKIKVDGRSLQSAFGGSMRMLQGTPYAFIRTPIGAGDHVVESETDDIKWMAWTYGSLDGLQQGRAYGTPVAIDLAIPCDDSLAVEEEIICGDVDGLGKILPEDSECGSIFTVYAESLDNYELVVDEEFDSGEKEVKFWVNVLDKTKDAKAVVRVVSRSGKFVEKTYTYISDKIDWDPKKVDFGTVPLNTPTCKTVTFTNLRTDAPVTVNELRAKYFPGTFSFNPSAFTIPPGQSFTVQVCATATQTKEQVDTIVAVLECFEQLTAELRVRSEAPIIYVEDQTWINIPASSPGVRKPVDIINSSDVDLIITGYDRSLLDGTGNFFNPENLDEVLPLTIAGGARHTFYVTYSPKGVAGVQHRVDVPFYSNAEEVDSIAILIGDGVDIDLYANTIPWNERVLDNVQTNQGITSYTQEVEFGNTGQLNVEFQEPFIRGADAAAFRIVDNGNTGGFPITLVSPAQPSKYITIEFVPTELPNRAGERDNYAAELVFPTNSSEQPEVVADLNGVAWQPQVMGADQDYGIFNQGDARLTLQIPISNNHYEGLTNPTTGDAQGTHGVVITDIRIVGANNNFTIDNAPSAAAPWRLAAGEEQMLEVTFDPNTSGQYWAQYEIVTQPADMTNGAAPYTPVYNLTAEVIGGEFTVEGAYIEQYVFNAADMIVKVQHSEGQTRTYDVSLPQGADASRFTIVEPANGVLTVAPGEVGEIHVQFIPDYVTKMRGGQTQAILTSKGAGAGINWRGNFFQATIDVTDQLSSETKTATVTGDGVYLETTNFVGEFNDDGSRNTRYDVEVGKSVNVAVSLDADPEALNSAELNEMRVRMSWDPALVQPRTNPEDFILNGTLAEGWTILKVETFPENSATPNSMEIDIADLRATPTPLVNDGTTPFFLVTFDSYLGTGADPNDLYTSPVNIYSYTVDFDQSDGAGVSKAYVLFRDIEGKIVIDPSCAEDLRLVSVSNTQFSVKPISPNPVTATATINYSIGLDGRTRIVLYNNMGERVMDIIDAQQGKGEYELTLDLTSVPAGTYYYRVISGPYTSEPQVITVVH